METSITYPGIPAIVPSARRFVSGILTGTPRADDMELIACEMITNAIQHTPTGHDGGKFTVRVHLHDGWARIEVSDAGSGQWHPLPQLPSTDQEYGRGLAIISALADKFGHDIGPHGQTLWAEASWTADPA